MRHAGYIDVNSKVGHAKVYRCPICNDGEEIEKLRRAAAVPPKSEASMKDVSVREFIEAKGLKKIQIACSIGIDQSRFSKYLHKWQPLPEKYVARLAKLLGLTREEIEANRVSCPINDH